MLSSEAERVGVDTVTTIRDVARLAGVSTSTVSLTFGNEQRVSKETAKKVRSAAEELGYWPNPHAQGLRRGRSRMIAVVVGDVGNPYFARILKSIGRLADTAGCQVMIADSNFDVERELSIVDQLDAQKIGGLILTPSATNAAYAARLQRIEAPVVLMDQNIPGGMFDFVGYDNRLGASMLTEHLIRLGHTRIAHIAGTEGLWNTTERHEGYREALVRAGIELDDSLVVDGAYQQEQAYQQTMRQLMRSDRATAILASNNLMGLGALKAVQELKFRCPDDISLAIVDSVPWSSLIQPTLTVLKQDAETVARLAIERLFDRIVQTDVPPLEPRETSLMPPLLLGESTGHAPA